MSKPDTRQTVARREAGTPRRPVLLAMHGALENARQVAAGQHVTARRPRSQNASRRWPGNVERPADEKTASAAPAGPALAVLTLPPVRQEAAALGRELGGLGIYVVPAAAGVPPAGGARVTPTVSVHAGRDPKVMQIQILRRLTV